RVHAVEAGRGPGRPGYRPAGGGPAAAVGPARPPPGGQGPGHLPEAPQAGPVPDRDAHAGGRGGRRGEPVARGSRVSGGRVTAAEAIVLAPRLSCRWPVRDATTQWPRRSGPAP